MSLLMRGGNQLVDAVKVLQKGGIQQGAVVADLGCGATGHFAFPAAHLVGPQGMVYAVDLLKSVLEAIESRRKMEGVDNVKTVWNDLERPGALQIGEQIADLTLVVNILGQVKEKNTVIAEARRVTKTGGILVVADWKLTQSPLGPPVERRLNPDEIKTMILAQGFEFREEFEPGPYHWGMVFIKK